MNAIAIITPANDVAPGFSEWMHRGRALLEQRNAVDFELGEWMNEGRELFGHQAEFDILADHLGIAPRRLKVMAKTVKMFPPAYRDPNLTFGHYEQVANLPVEDALELLKQASTNKWDTEEIRVAAVKRRALIQPPLIPEEDWAQKQLSDLACSWNRAAIAVREDFLEMVEEANRGVIDV